MPEFCAGGGALVLGEFRLASDTHAGMVPELEDIDVLFVDVSTILFFRILEWLGQAAPVGG